MALSENALTYDSKGNIKTISVDGALKATYHYDDLNQLIRENNKWQNKTIAYTYDNGGNILSVKEYAYTEGSLASLAANATNTYTYGDSNWKDKLTAFNGNTISYDAIGNPINYYNGYTFTLQNGRQLAGISGDNLTTSYKYDADGIRTSKTVNGVTTTYTLEGSNIVKETDGTNTLWYYYDASDSLIGFEYNGTPYFYVKNIQGDIIAITDATGTQVVTYLYDSWGKVLDIDGTLKNTIGEINPFRYRGYYYDTETGLYYLNSRYYDPNTKRFINADEGNTDSICGNNLFAYGDNNIINRADFDGRDAYILVNENLMGFLGHIGLLVEDEDGNWWHFYWGAGSGFEIAITSMTFFPVSAKTWCKSYTGELTVGAINNAGDYTNYTDMLYLDGDFSSCIDLMNNAAEKYGVYNVYFNNCSQVSLNILSKANTEHKVILATASAQPVPNISYKMVKNHSKNQKSSRNSSGYSPGHHVSLSKPEMFLR